MRDDPLGVSTAVVGGALLGLPVLAMLAVLLAAPNGPAHDETRLYECPGGLSFTGVWDWRHERLLDGDEFVIYPPQGCKITIIEGTK
jgi:hypothetical protein